MTINATIDAINKAGQSIWYDNLSRDVLNSGELENLIKQGVSGLTSNPSIFKKAIADSSDYDESIKVLATSTPKINELCEELMVQDVQAACDLLKSTYDKTGGHDGFASLEVDPTLANDTKSTIEAAKRLWNKLNRPNAMIKIPATKAGIPAIQAALESGININATLIFSVEAYTAVAEAYITALENLKKKGEPFKRLASVASFFVSRLDAITEKQLAKLVEEGKIESSAAERFLGHVAIANSHLAYKRYKELFEGPRFTPLRAQGAMVQRPLWASTGVKNPDFPELLYLETLVAKDTVNTLPPKTLNSLLKGAAVESRLEEPATTANEVFSSLSVCGVELDKVFNTLELDGVKAFADAYKALLEALNQKANTLTA